MDPKTIQTYNTMAKEYDEETVGFWEEFPYTFLDVFDSLAQEEILDVGSGPGRDALILQKRGHSVTCLDASEAMVKLSTERGLHSVVGDFTKLPFPDSSFDAVWAYTSLLHVAKKDAEVAVQEIHRVLKDKGVFALGLIEGEGEGYRESAGVTLPRWFSYYSKAEVEDLLTRNGFSIQYFEGFKPRTRNYLNFIAVKE